MKNLILVLFVFSLSCLTAIAESATNHTIKAGSNELKSVGETVIVDDEVYPAPAITCMDIFIEGFKTKKSSLNEARLFFSFCGIDLSAIPVDTELVLNKAQSATQAQTAGEVSVGLNFFNTDSSSVTTESDSYESSTTVTGKIKVSKIEGDNITFFYNLRFTKLNVETSFPHLKNGKPKSDKKALIVTGKFTALKSDISI